MHVRAWFHAQPARSAAVGESRPVCCHVQLHNQCRVATNDPTKEYFAQMQSPGQSSDEMLCINHILDRLPLHAGTGADAQPHGYQVWSKAALQRYTGNQAAAAALNQHVRR